MSKQKLDQKEKWIVPKEDGGVISSKEPFSKNHFRVRKIRDRYLLTTDQGNWVALIKKDYDNFRLIQLEY